MTLYAVGVNHATAPVKFRERLAIDPQAHNACLQTLVREASLDEVVLLSTCNRVEIYAQAPRSSSDRIIDTLADMRGVPAAELRPHCFMNGGDRAARHIFRVTASLESMVVGEPQILGQVKEAYRRASEGGTLGAVLDRCLTMAFRGAKRVRTETEIGRGGASVPSVTADLARRIFGDLSGSKVAVLGAGEMAQQTLTYMRAAGVSEMAVVNRNEGRGRALAEEVGGHYVSWAQLEEELSRSDIVVASTGASSTIIGVKLMRRVMKKRRHAPIFLIDIAVPRDIDAAVGELDGVYHYDIDGLQAMVDANLQQRVSETDAARRVVDGEVAEFISWHRRRDLGPTIRDLRDHTRDVVQGEISRTLSRVGPFDDRQQKSIDALAHNITNKLLHGPITRLRGAFEEVGTAGQGHENGGRVSGDDLADALRTLFALSGDGAGDSASAIRSVAEPPEDTDESS